MKRKCVWKNKNGFAMETAIWFILVISALCFLMTSVAMLGHYQTRLEAEELKRELQINQIGEYYIQSIKAGTVKNYFRDGNYGDGGGYRYSIENNELRVWRTRGNGDTILYVKAEFQENEQRTKDVKILSWKYATIYKINLLQGKNDNEAKSATNQAIADDCIRFKREQKTILDLEKI